MQCGLQSLMMSYREVCGPQYFMDKLISCFLTNINVCAWKKMCHVSEPIRPQYNMKTSEKWENKNEIQRDRLLWIVGN